MSSLGMLRKIGKDKCKKCNELIKEGDQCWHRTGTRPVWYHKSCYESLRQ